MTTVSKADGKMQDRGWWKKEGDCRKTAQKAELENSNHSQAKNKMN